MNSYKNKKVLIVEDDPIFVENIKKLLSLLGISNFDNTSDGEEAVSLSLNNDYDLILMDIILNGELDGIETSKRILSNSKKMIPIIYMTAHPENEIKNSIPEISPFGYLTKPVSDREFEIVVSIAFQRIEYEKQIMDKQKLFESVMDTSINRIFLKDRNGRYFYANRSMLSYHNLKKNDIIGRKLEDVLPDEILRHQIQEEDDMILNGKQKFIAAERKTLSREGYSETFITKSPILDSRGQIDGIATIEIDITDLKETQKKLFSLVKEKDVLIKELHDRIKNNMQIINSLLSIQSNSQKYKPVAHVLNDCRARVAAMGEVHEHLYRTEDFSQVNITESLKSTISFLKQMYDKENKINYTCIDKAHFYDIKNAVPIMLFVNEALTNSFKHAFPDNHQSNPEIVLACSNKDQKISFCIEDNGIGIENVKDFDKSETVGLFVMNTLSMQLNAEMKISGKNGTKVELVIPSSG